jgi:thymidylate kinase
MSQPGRQRWISETVELARSLPFTSESARALANRCLGFAGAHRGEPAALPWVIFDGASASGKDTQITLLSAALRARGNQVAVVSGRGGGTRFGPLLDELFEHNMRCAYPARWQADYQLKSAAWDIMRTGGDFACADIVLCNRGPVSQLAYSAVSMHNPGLPDARAPDLERVFRPSDLTILLSCLDSVLIARTRERAGQGGKALREVDSSQFISAVSLAFRQISEIAQGVTTVQANGSREEVQAVISDLTLPHASGLAVSQAVPAPRTGASASAPCPGSPVTQTRAVR